MLGFDEVVLSLFPQVTTHLKHSDALSNLFPYDGIVAVIAVMYCRYTVYYSGESRASRLCWSAVLGYLAYNRFDYWIQAYVHLLSFGIFFYEKGCEHVLNQKGSKGASELNERARVSTALASVFLVVGHALYSVSYPDGANSFFQSKLYLWISTNPLLSTLSGKIYDAFFDAAARLFPLKEFVDARDIVAEFVEPKELRAKAGHLLFVTFHIQVGMGYLGIAFLRAEQGRKNALVKIEDDARDCGSRDASKKFRDGAGRFILFAALPYMAQIVFCGGVNMYAFHCFRDDVHRAIRLNDLFAKDGSRFVATATSKTSNLTPDSYAANADTVVSTVYDMFNRNLFSLPKLMLIPGIVAKQPLMMLKITPLILLSDWMKSSVVSVVTTEVERINKEVKDLESMRTKVEQYDLKNSELIQRSGYDSVLFTERKWISLTEDIQDKQSRADIMKRSKGYFAGLQRHFIMMALVDCALAKLIAVGKIVAADIWVYARAIEDAINFVLMKSRAESELATMQSSIEVLRELKDIWDASEQRRLLDCVVDTTSSVINVRGLSYTRGSAYVSIEDLSLAPGIYAVTGANGSGKSTLFRLIMGCASNTESVDLHASIELNTPGTIRMPSSQVVEITQNFYFPLFSTPFDWIYSIDPFRGPPRQSEKEAMVSKLETELKALNFYPETSSKKSTHGALKSDLTTSKDDWFSDLSGGQKSKVELVRKVFSADRCPKVLLIDETFAPLDPESKTLVMQKLKSFCRDSIVLVIYHADVKRTEGERGDPDSSDDFACVESSNFFDNNVHVENGAVMLRPVCAED